MTTYTLGVDLGALSGVDAAIAEIVYPRISQAVEAVAQEAASRWQNKVYKARLWSGEKNPYFESIAWKTTGPFEALVWTNFEPALEIETGRPPRDLKKALPTSKKARVVQSGKKKGQRYLIIPFRHNTPTASGQGAHAPQMPASVYAIAKGLKASRVLAPGSKKPATRIAAGGNAVAQHSYSWGGRLPSWLASKKSPHHKTDIYSGMVRMDTSSGKQESSSYLTFRVMSESSPGWIIPARPGLYLAKGVADEMRPILEDAIGYALKLGG